MFNRGDQREQAPAAAGSHSGEVGVRRGGIRQDSQRRGWSRQGCVIKPRPLEFGPAHGRKGKAKVVVNMLSDVNL